MTSDVLIVLVHAAGMLCAYCILVGCMLNACCRHIIHILYASIAFILQLAILYRKRITMSC